MPNEAINLVLIDDNYFARQIIKTSIREFLNLDINVYSSDNGVEGLGYIFAVKPQVIIVDSTLPKYSGNEVIEYLISNGTLKDSDNQIVILNDHSTNKDPLPKNFIVLSKSNPDFLKSLLSIIKLSITDKEHLATNVNSLASEFKGFKLSLFETTIKLSSKFDKLNYEGQNKSNILKKFIKWLVFGVTLVPFTIVSFFFRSHDDASIIQKKKDLFYFRVHYYPSFYLALSFLFLLALQFIIGIVGGVTVGGLRINSVFSQGVSEETVNFNSTTISGFNFNPEIMEISNGLSLKKFTRVESTQIETGSGSTTENQTIVEYYASDNPWITSISPVIYNELNDFSIDATIPEGTSITFQLSPDGAKWFYFEKSSGLWEETVQEYSSSNTIEELRQNLSKYSENLNTGKVFYKVFFHSNGNSTPVLRNLSITKDQELITPLGNLPEDEEVAETEPLTTSFSESIDIAEIFVLNAAYANGNKVVSGRVDLVSQISDVDLAKIKVNIYFGNKDSLIGTTNLVSASIFGETQYLYELRTPSTPGGFVSAELEFEGKFSKLSPLVENATFTVNETGDQADFSAGDGSCDRDNVTIGSQCTLRAAIQEANALAGTDNISFNIPTSDSGYRDYDTPTTPSSGDSIGGDDYWTIQPATALPTITTTVNIDGATQTSNQADTNTSGPEVEIAGASLGAGSNGFNITGASVTVNSVVMNRFESQIQLSATTANNFVVTRSYFGVDVKAAADFTTTQKYGIHVNAVVTGVQIGNTTADGNVFGGFDINAGANEDSGVHLVCGTSGTAQQVVIAGNYFGMNPAGTIALPNFYGIWSRNNCNLLVGGDTSANRNYIGNSSNRGIFLRPANTNLPNIRIFNNYFGTDSTATQGRPNNGDILLQALQDYTGAQNPIMIGDSGKGNLFLNPAVLSIQLSSYRRIDIAYNSILAHQGIGGILTAPAMTPTVLMTISNNYFSTETSSDPYFGVAASIPAESQPSIAVEVDRDPVIKGNLFEQHNLAIRVNPTRVSSTIAYRGLSQPVLGGTSPFSGSLCGGVEKNCFSDLTSWEFDDFPNPWPGYIQTLSNPIDETLFITNNDISDLNPTDILIARMWFGSFELFSGTNRRTDLTNNTYDLPFPSGYEVIWFHAPIPNYAKGTTILTRNVRVGCTIPANCPASGATNGVSGQTTIITHFGYFSSFVYMLEHNRLVNGTITDAPGILKFENNHQASQTFSFDGDSTTHPVVGDRAEVWTNDTLADADIDDGTVGAYQLMEVEIVDANPIWNGTEWVITVDSTTDEDNVSTSGYDDGSGAYSGGGTNGPSGLPDGKTSLREAIIVANNFAQPVTIEFNIPTSDPNYNLVGYTGSFKLSISSALPDITASDLKIDGLSQTIFTGDTNLAVYEQNTMPVSGNATTGPEIILDGSGAVGASIFRILATDVHISNLGFYNSNNNRAIRIETGGNKSIIEANTFINNSRGAIVLLSSASETQIIDNVFRGNATDNYVFDVIESYFDDVVIDGNQFINNGGFAVNPQSYAASGSTVIITNNLIKSNGYNSVKNAGGISIAKIGGGGDPEFVNIEANTIINSANQGIIVWSPISRVTIRNNTIYDSEDLEIDLSNLIFDGVVNDVNGGGVTSNDSGDVDTGGNDLQNYPIIEAVEYHGGGQYKVIGDIDGNTSEDPFNIEICLSSSHSSGYGGCIESLGSGTANSPWEVTITIPGDDGTEGRIFSALATNANGSTSEFSENFAATTSNPDYTIVDYPVQLVFPINNVSIGDRTPILDWNFNFDPDTEAFEIYFGTDPSNLDLLTSVPVTQTSYSFTDILDYGTYYWEVIARRENGSEGGNSDLGTFTIVREVESLALIYPKGFIRIDERKPKFNWTISTTPETSFYEIYLMKLNKNGGVGLDELITEDNLLTRLEGITISEFTPENDLDFGNYGWVVVSYFEDGEISGRSEIGYFTIFDPTYIPPTPTVTLTPTPNDVSSSDDTPIAPRIERIIQSLPIIFTGLSAIIYSVAMGVPAAIIQIFGYLLGIPAKKKKFWGVVFDITSDRIIPFAIVRILDEDNKLIAQTTSNLDGKYSFQIDQKVDDYLLEVERSGYAKFEKQLHVSTEIIEDIPLLRLEQSSLIAKLLYHNAKSILEILRASLITITTFTLFYTIYACIISPVIINFVFLFIYIVMMMIYLSLLLKRKSLIQVVEAKTKSVVKNASVRIYEGLDQVDVGITDRFGKIRFDIKKGIYKVIVLSSGYNQSSSTLELTVVGSDNIIELTKSENSKFNLN